MKTSHANTIPVKTYYYLDGNVIKVRGDKNCDNDVIGRNLTTFIAFGQNKLKHQMLLDFMHQCYIYVHTWYGSVRVQLFRHPKYKNSGKPNDFSRDHLISFVMGMIMDGGVDKYRKMLLAIPYKLSDKFYMTPDNWLWIRGMLGSKTALWLYYRIQITWMKIMRRWNEYIRHKYEFLPVQWEYHQSEYIRIKPQQHVTDEQKEGRKKLFQCYSLQGLAFQLYMLPDTKDKRKLQRICLDMVGSHNYLLRLMFNGWVDITFIEKYKSMSSDRFGVHLDKTNDRDTYILSPEQIEEWDIEKALLQRIYHEFICHAKKRYFTNAGSYCRYFPDYNQFLWVETGAIKGISKETRKQWEQEFRTLLK